MSYRAPVAEMLFTLRHVAGLDAAITESAYGDLTVEDANAVLEEAGRLATSVIAPLDRIGDRHGATLSEGAVTTAGRAGGRPIAASSRAAGTGSAPRRITAGRACRIC